MKLTEQTYYGREAAQKWMSVSQFKAFQRCEAAAMAEIRGDYKRTGTALLVGLYVDTKLEGEDSEAFKAFQMEHPEIFKKDGTLKADFITAEKVYQKIINDELMCLLLSGERQTILQGTIAGVPFRGKTDSMLSAEQCEAIIERFPETQEVLGGPFGSVGAIVDGKVMKDFQPAWSDSEGRKVSWVKKWGYDIQAAVYQHLEGGHKPFIIAGASKEAHPDLTALYIPQSDLDAALRMVEEQAPIFQEIKEGKREPDSCGTCEWCRSQKVVTNIRNYKEEFLC